MARGFRLQPVLELAMQRLEASTTQLQKLGVQRREAQAKLDQLRGFQSEYQASRQQGLAQGMEPDRLRDFDAFLAKLELAIAQQTAEVERASRAWESEHLRWLELRSREEAMRVLERRHRLQLSAEEARVEQKQQDELAAGKIRRSGDG